MPNPSKPKSPARSPGPSSGRPTGASPVARAAGAIPFPTRDNAPEQVELTQLSPANADALRAMLDLARPGEPEGRVVAMRAAGSGLLCLSRSSTEDYGHGQAGRYFADGSAEMRTANYPHLTIPPGRDARPHITDIVKVCARERSADMYMRVHIYGFTCEAAGRDSEGRDSYRLALPPSLGVLTAEFDRVMAIDRDEGHEIKGVEISSLSRLPAKGEALPFPKRSGDTSAEQFFERIHTACRDAELPARAPDGARAAQAKTSPETQTRAAAPVTLTQGRGGILEVATDGPISARVTAFARACFSRLEADWQRRAVVAEVGDTTVGGAAGSKTESPSPRPGTPASRRLAFGDFVATGSCPGSTPGLSPTQSHSSSPGKRSPTPPM